MNSKSVRRSEFLHGTSMYRLKTRHILWLALRVSPSLLTASHSAVIALTRASCAATVVFRQFKSKYFFILNIIREYFRVQHAISSICALGSVC
jgi:hypothetical protein